MSPILAQGPLAHGPFLRATITNFFFFAGVNCFVLLPLYIQQLGGTEIEIGLVMGVYHAVGIVCQPLIGGWVDVLGRRPFMRAGALLLLLSTLLSAVAPAVPWFALVRFLQGVGFSAFFVSMFSYVIDLVPPERRGWALGIYGIAALSSTALAPLLGEWVIRRLGFQALFVMASALATVALVLVWGIQDRRHGGVVLPRGLEWARAGVAEVFRRHMAVTLFFGLGAGTLFVFLPTFAESLGVATLAIFYTGYAAAAVTARVFGGRLIDTRGRRAVIVPSMFLQCVATALLAVLGLLVTPTSRVPVVPVLFAAGLVFGGAQGFLYPALTALVADEAPPARRGAAVGIFSAVFLVGNAGGSFLFGYVTHVLGYGLMWTSLTGLLLLGALLSRGLAPPPPRAAEA